MIIRDLAIVFDYLMAYLGEDVYDKCMRAYFKKWQYKHPQPKDLRVVGPLPAVMEKKSGVFRWEINIFSLLLLHLKFK